MKCFFSFFVLALLISQPSNAGTSSSVGSPKVSEGRTKSELRFGYASADETSSQDDRFRFRQQIDHGFTDWYAARLVLQQDDRKGDNFEHNSIRLSNRFHLLSAKTHGFDLGTRLEYTFADGDKTPHSLGTGLYLLVPMNAYEIRVNQLFAHDVGENAEDGVEAEFRFQITRDLNDEHSFGVEGFHDFGNLTQLSGYSDQEHEIGPVFKGALPFGGLKYQTGYRAGISKGAADHNFKVFTSKSF